MTIKRPMLAATWKEGMDLGFPLISSPKLDGLRILCHPELGPVTRSFKPLPNKHVRELLSAPEFQGFDGELMLADSEANFNSIQSAMMRRDGTPAFEYFVFDSFRFPDEPWYNRVQDLKRVMSPFITPLEHVTVENMEHMLFQEELALKLEFEGLILRDPNMPYKSGRSTMREQGLVKVKRFQDAEGEVVRLVEQLHNTNIATADAFGLAERSSHKEHMVPAGCLGKIVVQTAAWGKVSIGSGFTQAERDTIWANQEAFLGKMAMFKYEPVLKDKPRFPIFLRFREDG